MNTLLGNAVSFAAACFTLASSWSRDRRRIYLYQAAQCFLIAGANIFFASVSGVTTCLLCGRQRVRSGCAGVPPSGKNRAGRLGMIPIASTSDPASRGSGVLLLMPVCVHHIYVNFVTFTFYSLQVNYKTNLNSNPSHVIVWIRVFCAFGKKYLTLKKETKCED